MQRLNLIKNVVNVKQFVSCSFLLINKFLWAVYILQFCRLKPTHEIQHSQTIYYKTLISGAREHRRTMRLELSLFANLGWINTLSSLDCDFIISEWGVFRRRQWNIVGIVGHIYRSRADLIFVSDITDYIRGEKSVMWRNFKFL